MDWRFLTVREVLGMALILLLIVGVVLIAPGRSGWFTGANTGFGPEWSCVRGPEAEPICVKNLPAPQPAH